MLAAVPPCAGECRLVRGDSVGNRAADPDLWGFCGTGDTQLTEVPKPPGASRQCRRRGVPGRMTACELQRCRQFLRGHTCRPDHRHVRAVPPPGMPGMPGIQASSNPVNALVPRLRTQGEVLASRSADAGQHPEHSPPDDSGTPQRRVTTPRMSRTNSTRRSPILCAGSCTNLITGSRADQPFQYAAHPMLGRV